MNSTDSDIQQILLAGGFVDRKILLEAASKARDRSVGLVDYLISEKILDKDLLGQAVAESFKVPYTDLNTNLPSKEQVLLVPVDMANKYRILIVKEDAAIIILGTDNPELVKPVVPQLEKQSGKKIKLSYVLSEDLEEAFRYYRNELSDRLNEVIKSKKDVATGILDEIINDAISLKSSDIHMEPYNGKVMIRYRIDGLMQEMASLDKPAYENVLNRVKVLAELRLDEHFAAQDGAIRYKIRGNENGNAIESDGEQKQKIDLRISIVPIISGEKIVIRLLSQYIKKLSLTELGLSDISIKLLDNNIVKPFGMILNVGPTGSGKTTTLYAILQKVKSKSVNITTIEDPVEYRIEGINQIQVNKETNLTFTKGLKSIVRQDPDIILVGEIRDKFTAEIATNAALTGHLLFSTFHANDAATAIPRLIDMGIEPFLLASSLELLIAQRLVRRICDKCKMSYEFNKAEMKKLYPSAVKYFDKAAPLLYKGKGCSSCNNTGYRGRVGIFEMIEITNEMRDLIMANPSKVQITELAVKQGFVSFFEDGIKKVKEGLTTLEEVIRVVPQIKV